MAYRDDDIYDDRKIIDISDKEMPGDKEPEKDTCDICEKEIGFLSRNKIVKDLYICNECAEKSAIKRHLKEVKKLPAEEVRKIIINKIEEAYNFTITIAADKYIFVDENREIWTIPYFTGILKNKSRIDPALIFSVSQIEDYELIDDGNSIVKGGKDFPPIRGLLFSGKGASGVKYNLSGDCERMQIKISVKDTGSPYVYIDLIEKKVARDSNKFYAAYVNAQKVLALLEMLLPEKEEELERKETGDFSSIEEIKKYKELLDMGAITEEEYAAKKKQLLNL